MCSAGYQITPPCCKLCYPVGTVVSVWMPPGECTWPQVSLAGAMVSPEGHCQAHPMAIGRLVPSSHGSPHRAASDTAGGNCERQRKHPRRDDTTALRNPALGMRSPDSPRLIGASPGPVHPQLEGTTQWHAYRGQGQVVRGCLRG